MMQVLVWDIIKVNIQAKFDCLLFIIFKLVKILKLRDHILEGNTFGLIKFLL